MPREWPYNLQNFLKPDNETGWWPWPVFSCLWHNEIVVIRCNSPQFLAGNLFRLSFQTLKCCGGPLRAIFSFVALKWRRFLGEILTIWGSSWEAGVQFLWKSICIFFIFLSLSMWSRKKNSIFTVRRTIRGDGTQNTFHLIMQDLKHNWY